MATLLELEQQIKNGKPIRMHHWRAHENIRFETACDAFVTEEGEIYNIHVRDMFSNNWETYSKEVLYIGCLCKFWDREPNLCSIGVLSKIDIEEAPYRYVNQRGAAWLHCEPLKPSDIKFYQGE